MSYKHRIDKDVEERKSRAAFRQQKQRHNEVSLDEYKYEGEDDDFDGLDDDMLGQIERCLR